MSLVELGSTGLKRFSGFVHEEFLPNLHGRRGMKVYREMRDNSPIVGACLGAIENLIRQVGWFVQPFSQDADDLQRAAFVESCRHDMSSTWGETLGEILTMLPYGWSLTEIVYKRRLGDRNDPRQRSKFSDGLVGWRKLPLRAQETLYNWEFDDEGGIQAMRQQALPDYETRTIPIEKALLFRAKSEKNNPEGRSILRNAYFPWYFAKKIAEIEGIGIERDLAGMPVGWIPPECFDTNATPAQKATKDAMEQIVRNVRRDEQEGILLPLEYVPGSSNKRFDFTLLTTGSRRNFDTSVILDRYHRLIAMTMFQDLILMGQPNTIQYKGSKMPELFAVSLGGWCDLIADVINAHGIPRLVRLNGWPTDRCPRLAHGDIEVPDLAALGDYISKLASTGLPLFPTDWTHLRRLAGIPDPPEGTPAVPQGEGPAGGPDNPAGPDDGPAPEPARDSGAVAPAPADALSKRFEDRRPLRLGEFAELTGYSREQVRKWADAGMLKTVRPLGDERRVPIVEAERLARELGIVA